MEFTLLTISHPPKEKKVKSSHPSTCRHMSSTSNFAFWFDLLCALSFVALVPLFVLVVFRPIIVRKLVQIAEERERRMAEGPQPTKLEIFLRRFLLPKTRCPHCGTKNESRLEYCTKCGSRLRL